MIEAVAGRAPVALGNFFELLLLLLLLLCVMSISRQIHSFLPPFLSSPFNSFVSPFSFSLVLYLAWRAWHVRPPAS